MHASQLIDATIIKHVAPFLRSVGFRKKAHRFWRDAGPVLDVVTIQKSQWNDAEDGRFAINLGLYWFEIQQAIGRAAKATPPRDADCTVFQRLGIIACDGRDVWWTVREEADVSSAGADVVQKLRDHGLPWLERGHDIRHTLEYARKHYFRLQMDAVEAYILQHYQAA
jgi:hypothetical protein